MRAYTRRRLLLALKLGIATVPVAILLRWSDPEALLPGSILLGFVFGFSVGIAELFLLRNWLKGLPFALHLVVKSLALLAVLFLAFAALNLLDVALEGTSWAAYLRALTSADVASGLIVAFAVIMVYLFIIHLDRLLGRGVLVGLLTGRYHQPRREQRIFMFLDLKDSTALADRMPAERYFRFLQRYFAEMSEPILETNAEVYQYVGDEVVLSWPLRVGLTDGNCVRAFFLIEQRLAAQRASFLNEFGTAPEFKAGLHAGEVIAAEIGEIKREIVYNGDVLNTTSRIQAQCNALGHRLLVSEKLAIRLPPDPAYDVQRLGPVPLRGKDEPLALAAIRRVGATFTGAAGRSTSLAILLALLIGACGRVPGPEAPVMSIPDAAPVASEEFAIRRAALLARLSDGVVLLQARPAEKSMEEWGFVQDAAFLYYSGLPEVPSAILALDGPARASHLFLPPAPESFGVAVEGLIPRSTAEELDLTSVRPWSEFAPWVESRLAQGVRTLYVDEPRRPEGTGVPPGMAPVAGRRTLWKETLARAFPQATFRSAKVAIMEQRAVKSDAEIRILETNALRSAPKLACRCSLCDTRAPPARQRGCDGRRLYRERRRGALVLAVDHVGSVRAHGSAGWGVLPVRPEQPHHRTRRIDARRHRVRRRTLRSRRRTHVARLRSLQRNPGRGLGSVDRRVSGRAGGHGRRGAGGRRSHRQHGCSPWA